MSESCTRARLSRVAMAASAQPGGALGDLPPDFKCPLSEKIMTDPVRRP